MRNGFRFFQIIPHKSQLAAIVFSLSIASINLACKRLKTEVVFDGYAVEGAHSRGIYIRENKLVVTGVKGVFTVFDLKGTILEQDSIPSMDDFRDVVLFADSTMLLLNSSNHSRMVLRIPGRTEKMAYTREDVFLDGVDFWDEKNGMAYGDPTRGQFFLLRTKNGGSGWVFQDGIDLPAPAKGEAGFAASGTGIDCVGDSTVYFGTGMCDSPRVFVSHDRGINWETRYTPMKGGEAFGIYSLSFWNPTEGIIIGGSYLDVEVNDSICWYTPDGGISWIDRSRGLGGYCSTVQGRADGKLLIASGKTGTYYSFDKGDHWKILTPDPFYASVLTDTHIAFCGKDGVVRIYTYAF